MERVTVFEHLPLDVEGLNEDHIAELVKARSTMWDGTDATSELEEYLCHHLSKHPSNAADLLHERVGDALSPCISFEGAMGRFNVSLTTQQCQVQKMLWIDQMILDIQSQLQEKKQ